MRGDMDADVAARRLPRRCTTSGSVRCRCQMSQQFAGGLYGRLCDRMHACSSNWKIRLRNQLSRLRGVECLFLVVGILRRRIYPPMVIGYVCRTFPALSITSTLRSVMPNFRTFAGSAAQELRNTAGFRDAG